MKRTKSSKRQNKKTRVVKQRGGGNKYFDALEKNLPFSMTITKAIDGTPDIPRDPRAKKLDCICEPDAYQNPVKTFECAKQGKDDSRGFAFRQNPITQVESIPDQAAVDAAFAARMGVSQNPIPDIETESEQNALDDASAKNMMSVTGKPIGANLKEQIEKIKLQKFDKFKV